jgi:hypothetical protein
MATKTGYALTSAYDAAKAAASQTSVDTIDGIVDSILAIAQKIDDMLELDGAVYRFTVNALEQGPSGTGSSAEAIRIEMDANSVKLASIAGKTDMLPAVWFSP